MIRIIILLKKQQWEKLLSRTPAGFPSSVRGQNTQHFTVLSYCAPGYADIFLFQYFHYFLIAVRL